MNNKLSFAARIKEAFKFLRTGEMDKKFMFRFPDAPIDNGKFFPTNNIGAAYEQMAYDAKTRIVDGYQANDILYSIINIIIRKAMVPSWGVYKVIDESKAKQYKAIMKNISSSSDYSQVKDAIKLKNESYQKVSDAKLDKLIAMPNELQSWPEMLEEICIFLLTTGNYFGLVNLLGESGLNSNKPQDLYTMPVPYVKVLASRGFPAKLLGYKFQSNDGIIEYVNEKIKNVIHIKYANPDYSMGNNFIGQSPIQAASDLVTRINRSTVAGAKAFQNMGVDGIVYIDKDVTMDQGNADLAVEQAGELKEKWYSEYQGADNVRGTAFSPTKLGYLKIGVSPVDLAIIESEKWDVNRLCNVYQLNPVLLNPESATLNNLKEAYKGLITNAVLPLMAKVRDAFNRQLQTNWGYAKSGLIIDFDIDSFYELHDDMKDKVEWVMKMPITLRAKLTMLDQEIPEGMTEEMLNQVHIASSLQNIEDVMNGADSSTIL